MNFFNSLGLVGLVSIPIIIIMYMLKQKYKDQTVSSLFLWKEALELSQSEKPWQKVKRNLLMFLQILAAFILALALANPYIARNNLQENYIFVLDMSMSMKAEDAKPNRFENAREQLIRTVNSMPPGSVAALVAAGSQPYISSGFTDDKNAIIRKINSLTPANSTADIQSTETLVNMLREQLNATVYIFSDGGFDISAENKLYARFGEPFENMAITLISHTVDGEHIICLVKVKNYGNSTAENSVSLYTDDKIHDVKSFTLEPGEEKDIFFTSVPMASYLTASLSDAGLFPYDSSAYNAVVAKSDKKALLVTNGNVFLENILTLMPGIDIYKSNEVPDAPTGYFLYIFDGLLPENIPSDGHILLLNPPAGNSLIETTGELEAGNLTVRDNKLLKFMSELDFAISKTKEMVLPDWALPILDMEAGDAYAPVVFAGEQNNRKILVMGFDLHNTDLPLKKEFPVFMYNMLSWFIPPRVTASDNIKTGDAVRFNLYPDAESARIISPAGNITAITPGSAAEFGYTDEPGIYVLEQYTSEDRIFERFAINTASGESDFYAEVEASGGEAQASISLVNTGLRKILILILIAVLVAEWLVYMKYSRKHKRGMIIIAARCLLLALLISTLAGFTIKRYTDDTATVFLFDLSDSMRAVKQPMEEVAAMALEYKSEKELVGSVCLGENAVVDSMPSENYSVSINTVVKPGFSNITEGLRLAQAILPENSMNRIVLFSDGAENAGNAISQARILKNRGISLDVYPISGIPENETQFTELTIPKTINKNVRYDIEAIIHSRAETSARLLVYKNDNLIVSDDIMLRAGENRFVFTDMSDVGGSIIYRAEIQPAKDTFHENNSSYAYGYVEDEPNILVADIDGSGSEIMKILETSGVYGHLSNAAALPTTLDRLSVYDAIVLPDISVDDMPAGFPDILESYVKDLGGGLLVTGGENSFALGGYYRTTMETILPVEMELKDKGEVPNLGLIIVLDRSGSMSMSNYGVSKLSLAKEAAIRGAETLNDEDFIGVLAFDDGFDWAVSFKQVMGNRQGISNQIASISEGGGTSILPGLHEAYEVMSTADTKLKHIILLTDGQAEQQGYDYLLDNMSAEGITLSTVAVGSDADTRLLERLATRGGGRYYFTNEFTDLPKIFAKETFLAGRDYIKNVTFYPETNNSGSLLEGVTTLPPLNGYIAVTGKDRADIVLSGPAPDSDPILASWQYGLGRSVAFMSDMNGKWTGDMLSSDEGVRLFRNMVSWIIKRRMNTDISVSAEINADKSDITLHIPYSEGISRVSGVFISPDMNRYESEFTAVLPGEYRSSIPVNKQGAYIASVNIEKISGIENISSGFSISYPPEYDIRNFTAGGGMLKALAAETGGRVLSNPDQVFTIPETRIYAERELNGILLGLALLLLLFDVAIRRFPIITEKLERMASNVIDLKNTKDKHIMSSKNNSIKNKETKEAKNAGAAKASTASLLVSGKNKRAGR